MIKSRWIVLILMTIVLFSGCSGSQAPSESVPEDTILELTADDVIMDEVRGPVVVNQAIVMTEDGVSREQLESMASQNGATIVGELHGMGIYQLKLSTKTVDELDLAIKTMRQDPSVAVVSANGILHETSSKGILWSPLEPEAYDAANRHYSMNYGFEKAWRYVMGSLVRLHPVTVGIMDSGVSPLYDGVDSQIASNLEVAESNAGLATLMHADMVANLIAGEHGDDFGITGAASILGRNLSLISTDIHERSLLEMNEQVNASTMYKVFLLFNQQMKKGAEVINCSFGKVKYDETIAFEADMFTRYMEKVEQEYPKVLIVASAGNDRQILDGANHYPGGIVADNLITVGGIREDLQVSLNTNFAAGAEHVGIAGFVDHILVGTHPETGEPIYLDGTSFAAPMVTSTAALCKSINPELTGKELKGLLIASASETGMRVDGSKQKISIQVGGRLLRMDEAVYQALMTTGEAIPDKDMLMDMTSLSVEVLAIADGYQVEASIPAPKEGANLTSYSMSNNQTGDSGAQKVTPDSVGIWQYDSAPRAEEERIWVMREDSGSRAYVIIGEAPLPAAGLDLEGMMVFSARLSLTPDEYETIDGSMDPKELLDELLVWEDLIGDSDGGEYGWFRNTEGSRIQYLAPDIQIDVQYSDGGMISQINARPQGPGQENMILQFHQNGAIRMIRTHSPTGKESVSVYAEISDSGNVISYQEQIDDVIEVSRYSRDTGILASNERYRMIDNIKTLDGIQQRYYKNGQLEYEKPYREGKLNGTVLYYRENGNLRESAEYVDDQRDGLTEVYLPVSSGADTDYLSEESHYSAGQLDGVRSLYGYKDGQHYAVSRFGYKNGILSGVYEVYNWGILYWKGQTENGLATGTWTEYHDDGSVKATVECGSGTENFPYR